MTSENEGFLERWSRRKQLPEEEPEAASPVVPDDSDGGDEPEALESAEAPALTDEDMPDLDTLSPDSDLSPFFSSGVSERLRQKALHKIFHSARYNVKDGLDDYDEDYTLLESLGDADTWEWRRQRERLAAREEERERKRLEAEAEAEAEAELDPEVEAEAETDAETEDEASRIKNIEQIDAEDQPEEK